MTDTLQRPVDVERCGACRGDGVVESRYDNVDDLQPCRECAGAGWFDAEGRPADAPTDGAGTWQAIVGVLGVIAVFAIIIFGPWLVEHCWPGALVLAAALITAVVLVTKWVRS